MKISNFIAGIWNGIKSLFSKMPVDIKLSLNVATHVINNLKRAIDSPVVDVLTALIPGQIDDLIKNKLRQALPVFAQALNLADKTMSLSDPEAIMQTALQSFRELDPEIRPAFYHSLSVLIAQVAADGKLSWSDGVAVVEWYYQNKVKES